MEIGDVCKYNDAMVIIYGFTTSSKTVRCLYCNTRIDTITNIRIFTEDLTEFTQSENTESIKKIKSIFKVLSQYYYDDNETGEFHVSIIKQLIGRHICLDETLLYEFLRYPYKYKG